MKKNAKGELVRKVLLLTVVGGAVTAVCVLPGLAVLYKHLGAKSSKDRYRVKRALVNMEKRGLIVQTIIKGRERRQLTESGKHKAWSYLAEDMCIQRQKRWDRKWRLVMFDIPEQKAKIRREVSWKLKDIGMKSIQNSVFITPFPCTKEVQKITDHYGVAKHVAFVEGDTIQTNHNLLAHFKLK